MSNSLDPDQAHHIVGLDRGPNCVQALTREGGASYLSSVFYLLCADIEFSRLNNHNIIPDVCVGSIHSLAGDLSFCM